MTDREKVIKALKCQVHQYKFLVSTMGCNECDYRETNCEMAAMCDAIELLKADKPRLITEADFMDADNWGYLPVWTEERGGSLYSECILKAALTEKDERYWTARPTEEQREAMKWNDNN